MGCAYFYMQKIELRYWWEYGDEKTKINKLNERRSLIPRGFRVLRLSELPMYVKAAYCHMELRMIKEI